MPPEDICRNHSFIASIGRIPGIKFRRYIPEDESKGTAYEGQHELLNGKDRFDPQKRICLSKIGNALQWIFNHASLWGSKEKNPVKTAQALWQTFRQTAYRGSKWRRLANKANAFRILVLGKYGGIYFDFDVLFLKDLRPLCNVEFFYQWSNQGYGNNAVLHFYRNSANILALAERSIKIHSCRSVALLQFKDCSTWPEDIYVFPSYLFDPLWIAQDREISINNYCNRFADFFTGNTPITMAEFFPGAYAYHWHNYWDMSIRQGTVVGYLSDEIWRKFNASYAGIL